MELLERTVQRRRRARADAKGWQGLAGATEYWAGLFPLKVAENQLQRD